MIFYLQSLLIISANLRAATQIFLTPMKGYGLKLSGSCVDLVVIPNTQSHMNRAWIVFINDPDSGFTLDLVRTAFTDNIL